MEKKSLKDISWNISEEEYRKDPALSYSILAKYEREGFNNLDKLFEKIESPSLVFGSAVDTLITGSEEDFNKQFMVAQLDITLSDTLILITKKLFDTWKDSFDNLKNIPDNLLLESIQDIPWNNHWLDKTKVKKIKEDCASYYKLLYLAAGRTIISTSTYNEVLNVVDKLKSSKATKFNFEEDPFNDNIEKFYQLKFKASFEKVDYRCMADLLIVLHDTKVIVPIDLKTSYKPEWDFYKSFIEWRYDIQARLYWKIIRQNMDKDPYFKDFKLSDYRFIVINKKTLTPLVWIFPQTQSVTEIKIKDDLVLRHPFIIGKELKHYLDDKPTVPDEIELYELNDLSKWLNKL